MMQTAQALKARIMPDWFLIDKDNGFSRAVLSAKTAAIAGICGIKGFDGTGKMNEAEMDELRLEPFHGAFMDLIMVVVFFNFSGNGLKPKRGFLDFLTNDGFFFQIRSKDVIVGHDQTVGAVDRKNPVQCSHCEPCFFSAGANGKRIALRDGQLFYKRKHWFWKAPGINRKY